MVAQAIPELEMAARVGFLEFAKIWKVLLISLHMVAEVAVVPIAAILITQEDRALLAVQVAVAVAVAIEQAVVLL